jgi:hypothetical protein
MMSWWRWLRTRRFGLLTPPTDGVVISANVEDQRYTTSPYNPFMRGPIISA